MAEPFTITDPAALSDLSFQVATLALNEAGSGSQPGLHIKLVLLQPLEKPEMLAQCRTYTTKLFPRLGLRPRNERNFYGEPLDMQPLSSAWRQALRNTTAMTKVTFDLSLPKPERNSREFQKVFFDTNVPRSEGLVISTQQVMTMTLLLAVR